VQRDLFEPPPVTLRDLARDMIRGVYKLDDRLLILLDADQAIASAVTRAKTPAATPARGENGSGEAKAEWKA
jgi:chemotaxis signal transduction protein